MEIHDDYYYESVNEDTPAEPVETEIQIKERQHKESAVNCKSDGLSAADCVANGHSIRDAVNAGYNLREFNVSDLKGQFSLGDLKNEFSLGELKSQFNLQELKETYSIDELKNEFNLHDLKHEFQLQDLKSHFELSELKNEFILSELKDYYTVRELNTQFSLREISQELPLSKIKSENYTAKDFKLAGFTAHELYGICTAAEMRGDGYTPISIGISELGNKMSNPNGNIGTTSEINLQLSKAMKLVGEKRADYKCNHVVNEIIFGEKNNGLFAKDYKKLGELTDKPERGVVVVGKDGKHVGYFIDEKHFVHSSSERKEVIIVDTSQLKYAFPEGFILKKNVKK